VDSELIFIFAPDSGSPEGLVGQNFCGKKDVYERYLRPSNLANSGLRRYATETSTLGVLYLAHSLQCVVSISLGVGYRVAYPDARQCESPTMG